jgi:uncharacterized membrane protein
MWYRTARNTAPGLIALCTALLAKAQPVFYRLGVLPGSSYSSPYGLSRDGSVVVGDSSVRAFRWSLVGGIQDLGDLPGHFNEGSIAYGCSADGLAVVGSYGDTAFLWTAARGLHDVGPDVPLLRPRCWAVSGDGTFLVVAGVTGSRYAVMRWSPPTGAVELWPPPPGFNSVGGPYSISADGRVIGGVIGRSDGESFEPFVWTSERGLRPLGDLRPPLCVEYGAVRAVSADGRTLVGQATGPNTSFCLPEAFRWTEATGLQGLGVPAVPQGRTGTIALAVTAEGSVVSGEIQIWNGGSRACIWPSGSGPRYLDEFLRTQYGLDTSGWELWTALVSADGAAIAGTGRSPEGHPEGWTVTGLHLVCRPDLNRDGRVDLADFMQMLEYYSGADTRADVLIDGRISVQDFLEFLRLFAAGCAR